MKLTESYLKNAVTEQENIYFSDEEIQQILQNQEIVERLRDQFTKQENGNNLWNPSNVYNIIVEEILGEKK